MESSSHILCPIHMRVQSAMSNEACLVLLCAPAGKSPLPTRREEASVRSDFVYELVLSMCDSEPDIP